MDTSDFLIRLYIQNGYSCQTLADMISMSDESERPISNADEIISEARTLLHHGQMIMEIDLNSPHQRPVEKWHFMLLAAGKGEVVCSRCSRTFKPENLTLEIYERRPLLLEVPLMGGGGRRLFCGNGHILLSMVDRRS